MFKGIRPVCPVLDMKAHLTFWGSLGFKPVFGSARPFEDADYVGVARDGLEIHLQTFTEDQLQFTQTMAIRIEMTSREALESLHTEWDPKITISAKLDDKPWGTREFGFYDPTKTPFFFYVDSA